MARSGPFDNPVGPLQAARFQRKLYASQVADAVRELCRGHRKHGQTEPCLFTENQLYRYEKQYEHRRPGVEHIEALCRYYQVSPEALGLINWRGDSPAEGIRDSTLSEHPERPVGLRPHIEQAFEHIHVSVDFAGYSGETLHGALQEPLDKIRAGQLAPETIAIRVLLYDTSTPMSLPCRADDLADDPDFRDRAGHITRRHINAVVESLQELQDLGLVKEATTRVRIHNCAPLFKLYILNNDDAFFGWYPVREHTLTIKGEPRTMYDLFGKDALMFRNSATEDPASAGSQYVEQARMWFDSVWHTISHDFTP